MRLGVMTRRRTGALNACSAPAGKFYKSGDMTKASTPVEALLKAAKRAKGARVEIAPEHLIELCRVALEADAREMKVFRLTQQIAPTMPMAFSRSTNAEAYAAGYFHGVGKAMEPVDLVLKGSRESSKIR